MSVTAEHLRALEDAYRKASADFLAKMPVVDGERVQRRGAKAAYQRLVKADRAYREAVAAHNAQEYGRVQP
jgi:hypothetical protein